MLAIFLFVIPGLMLIGGIGFVKAMDQRRLDASRQTYLLAFPSDLDAKNVQAWLHSISGTLQTGPHKLGGSPTIVFETLSTARGIFHRLRVPWHQADYVISQLRSLIPGIHVTPDNSEPWVRWTYIVELGESDPSRPLRILSPEVTAASLLASMGTLNPGEAVIYQWVITPAVPEKMPTFQKPPRTSGIGMNLLMSALATPKEEVDDRRAKMQEPNVLGVLRIAVQSDDLPRAGHLLSRVESALASVRGPHNRFVRQRALDGQTLQARLMTAAGLLHFPAKLTTTELTALLSWPIGSPHVAGIAHGRTRHLPVNESVPREGALIGRSTFPGNERPIALSSNYRPQHLHIMGGTGTGKTTLMVNLIAHDMNVGNGVLLIDPKGDLFNAALARVPAHRLRDVIVVDINDSQFPVGFNPLRDGSPERAVSELIKLFEAKYPDIRRGVWAPAGFFRGLTTLANWEGAAFCDIVPLLSPQWATDQEAQWRQEVMGAVKDETMAAFWQKYLKEPTSRQDTYAAPVVDRAWQFNERPVLRNITGQSKSTFDMRDVATGKKMLFVNLHGDVDDEAAKLLGTMLLNSFRNAAMNRTDRRTHVQAYVDEFADFMDLPVGFEEMLAKLRSTNTGITIAHQNNAQLRRRPELLSVAMGNTRNKIVFNVSAEDARTWANEFRGRVTENDLMYLNQYEAIARLMTDQGVSDPMTLRTLDYVPSLHSEPAVRSYSRSQYGRSITEVEAEIRSRRKPSRQPPKRREPRIGDVD